MLNHPFEGLNIFYQNETTFSNIPDALIDDYIFRFVNRNRKSFVNEILISAKNKELEEINEKLEIQISNAYVDYVNNLFSREWNPEKVYLKSSGETLDGLLRVTKNISIVYSDGVIVGGIKYWDNSQVKEYSDARLGYVRFIKTFDRKGSVLTEQDFCLGKLNGIQVSWDNKGGCKRSDYKRGILNIEEDIRADGSLAGRSKYNYDKEIVEEYFFKVNGEIELKYIYEFKNGIKGILIESWRNEEDAPEPEDDDLPF